MTSRGALRLCGSASPRSLAGLGEAGFANKPRHTRRGQAWVAPMSSPPVKNARQIVLAERRDSRWRQTTTTRKQGTVASSSFR